MPHRIKSLAGGNQESGSTAAIIRFAAGAYAAVTARVPECLAAARAGVAAAAAAAAPALANDI